MMATELHATIGELIASQGDGVVRIAMLRGIPEVIEIQVVKTFNAPVFFLQPEEMVSVQKIRGTIAGEEVL